MIRSANARRKSNQVDFYEDECEILNINYDDALTASRSSKFNNLQKNSYANYIQENVELSLELQIANSLKNIVTSPRNENLSLLDVTIVQPLNDNDYNSGCVENTVALTSSKVKELLAAIDNSETRKYKILERHNESEYRQCKPQQELNNIPLIKTKSFLDKKMIRKLEPQRQKLKRKESSKYGHITLTNDPTEKFKCTSKLENIFDKRNMEAANINLELKTSTSVTVLKPFKGRNQCSFKYLQDHMQVGDNLHKYAEKQNKRDYRHPLLIPTKDSYTSADYNSKKLNERETCISNTPQIYATPKTFDKLKHILECQNPENRNNGTDNKDNPCSCQHCELIGVLMDSQKKPFLSNSPVTKSSCVKHKHHSYNGKGNTVHRRELQPSEDFRSKHKAHESDSTIIRELSCRLEALERRVANQEQLTVPKDYFKKIINKIINKQLRVSPHDSSIVLKSIGTQYHPIEKLEKELKSKKAHKSTKYRNVQIQQNDRQNYVVNPVLLQSDVSARKSRHEVNNMSSKILGINPITAISDYFLKKRESDKKNVNCNRSQTKTSPLESFYKWGEEIIKPGFDLKSKILLLIAEQIGSAKNTKCTNYKNINSKQSIASNVKAKPKMSSTSDCKKFQNSSISKINMSQKSDNSEEKPFPVTSNKTLKRMLHLMSEKIYKDHVKPTVDSIKHEQRSINNDNFSQVFNIKKAMDDVFEKINFNENNIKISNTSNRAESRADKADWKADFLEPLEIPSSIKSNACNSKRHPKIAKTIRKSGIPVRVVNTATAESISSSNAKFKESKLLHISQFQSTIKSNFKCVHSTDHLRHKTRDHVRSDKTQEIDKINQRNQVPTNEIDNQQNRLVPNSKEDKFVQIKYINPKALFWTDESSASIKIKNSK